MVITRIPIGSGRQSAIFWAWPALVAGDCGVGSPFLANVPNWRPCMYCRNESDGTPMKIEVEHQMMNTRMDAGGGRAEFFRQD